VHIGLRLLADSSTRRRFANAVGFEKIAKTIFEDDDF
jgi:hypothetical protein